MNQGISWRPIITDPVLVSRVIELAVRCASAFRNPDSIALAQELVGSQTSYARQPDWSPLALSTGNAGIALACGQLAIIFPLEEWDQIAHEHLKIAVSVLESHHGHIGLFSGLSGLAFTIWHLSRNGLRYRTLLKQVDDALSAECLKRLTQQYPSDGVPFDLFDVVSGWSGVIAYLQLRKDRADFNYILDRSLARLLDLFDDNQDPRRWHTPSHLCADPMMASQYPGGSLNCGMAHGAAGVLAVLALSCRDSTEAAAIKRTVRSISTWLVAHQVPDSYGANWPAVVPLSLSLKSRLPSRCAWCYGSPGITRALFLAARVLDDPGLEEFAVKAFEVVFRRHHSEWGLPSPTFCHGLSGLLAIALRFTSEIHSDVIQDGAEQIVRLMVEKYEPDRPFGFRDRETETVFVDRPGLLDGAAGVVLSLLASATAALPHWDRMFVIA